MENAKQYYGNTQCIISSDLLWSNRYKQRFWLS